MTQDKQTFPPGEATLLGQELMLERTDPLIMLTTADRKVTFYLSGGLAAWPRHQDGVNLVEITTPTPEFRNLRAQGARQDGGQTRDTVYDPMQIDAVFLASATTPDGLSRVVSEWIAANDPEQLCRLEWFTFEGGLWWCDVRLEKRWIDRIQQSPRRAKKQVLSTVWMNDLAFWQSVDSTCTWAFSYQTMLDTFKYDTSASKDLGENWPQYRYDGEGGGYWYANGDRAVWRDDPEDPLLTEGVSVLCGPYKDFATSTDYQVIDFVIGSFQEITFPDGAENHAWGRLNRDEDGEWAGDGIRAAVGPTSAVLHRFNDFEKTRIGLPVPLFPPPFIGEKFRLILGYQGNPRKYRLLRALTDRSAGVPVLTVTEQGTGSALGPDHRGVGFGGRAGAALITQATPASVRKVAAGDNRTETQEGFLTLTNIGERDGWPQIVFEGPGLLEIANGPGSTDMIKFGPLEDGQRVLISTHPRYRAVVDLTQGQVGQQLDGGQKLIDTIVKLLSMGQVPPALQWFESVFGIKPPQGPLYSLLDGRFTRPIPGVRQPRDATTSRIAIRVRDGNANTKVTASVTPMRRWPEAVHD
ncbi:minor tail protein [Mycobacterium phage Brusacoram]|uniref:Minor tail protein n=3 Tax=Fishburnevirus TaxID=1983734 RepID=A0A0K1Y6N2_9CAUD|nr:minor tail protein [Mycobacterium phage Brusacoram]YP_009964351.1 minor tail protein [Mycobacterium phage Atcoo]AKY02544.1 minor tail protein [Mycobacterium phage Brusacoram]ATW59147.1 minor tail protein [Mycobacterium phage Thespis]QGJ88596.1 minor tail protein [Mycobacterium phage Atcoo]